MLTLKSMPPTITEVFFCAHADVFPSNKFIVSFGKDIEHSCQSISWPTQSFFYKLQNISHLSVLTSTERWKISLFLILFFFITTVIGCTVLAKSEQRTATGNGEVQKKQVWVICNLSRFSHQNQTFIWYNRESSFYKHVFLPLNNLHFKKSCKYYVTSELIKIQITFSSEI